MVETCLPENASVLLNRLRLPGALGAAGLPSAVVGRSGSISPTCGADQPLLGRPPLVRTGGAMSRTVGSSSSPSSANAGIPVPLRVGLAAGMPTCVVIELIRTQRAVSMASRRSSSPKGCSRKTSAASPPCSGVPPERVMMMAGVFPWRSSGRASCRKAKAPSGWASSSMSSRSRGAASRQAKTASPASKTRSV